ncbi:MAG: hypothetical protein V4713_03800 [Pseudomonadota bacterium]
MTRAKKGYTFDACHGCGQVPSDWQGRPAKGVCSNCQQTLDLARRLAKEQTAAGAAMLAVGIPTQPHWLPYLTQASNFGGEKRPNIQNEFWKLALLCSSPAIERAANPQVLAKPKKNERMDWSPHRPEDVRLMPAGIAAQFDTLFDAIRQGLDAAREEGKERGQSLLGQLASGDITANKFNEMTLRGHN